MRSMRRSTAVFLIVLGAFASPLIAGQMFWRGAAVDTTSIFRADLNGSNVEAVLSCSVACGFGSMALDTTERRIYVVEFEGIDSTVIRSFYDGSNREDFLIVTGQAAVSDLAVDPIGRDLYWVLAGDEPGDQIQRKPLDGSTGATILTADGVVQGLNVDPGGKLYWTEAFGGAWRLRRANLDGSGVEDLATDTVEFSDTTLDLAGTVYWLAGSGIHRANLDGSNPSTLPVSLVGPTGIAFDADSGLLYVTGIPQPFDGKIVTVDPADGAMNDVLTGLAGPAEIAIDPAPGDVPASSTWTLVLAVLLLLTTSTVLLARGLPAMSRN